MAPIIPKAATPKVDKSSASPGSPQAQIDLHMLSPYGTGSSYAWFVVMLAVLLAIGIVLSPLFAPLWMVATGLTMLVAFVLTRHYAMRATQKTEMDAFRATALTKTSPADTSKLPAVYFLYVLGSGGHTTEMIDLIKQQFKGASNLHRRYIITSGDSHSRNKESELETDIGNACAKHTSGSYDTIQVTRARAVHQSYLTSVFTSLMCAFEILAALTVVPQDRRQKEHGAAFRYPHVIVTNGPGTGFIVCIVAHLLKLFYLAPQNRLKMVYIETWARFKSLSLTGKLFFWTDIADLFVVQSDSLSKITGKHNIGNVSLRGIRGKS